MKKEYIHNENDTFLADWMAGKVTDEKLKSLVSLSDFEIYKKIKLGVDTFEKPSFDHEKGYNSLSNKIKAKNSTISRSIIPSWLYAVAATLVLFFAISQFLLVDKTFSTGFAEQNDLIFKDASRAYLNANTTIKYARNWEKNRKVSLEGEAFFEVKKGKDFSIKTPNGIVQVLGTKFNVISRKNFFEVICYEGVVSVTANGVENKLTAGQAWRMIENNLIELWNIDIPQPTWLKGESSFKSLPIKYVMNAIENQFQVKFQATNIDEKIIFTGSFGHQDLENALQSICLPLNLNFKIVDNQTVVLSDK